MALISQPTIDTDAIAALWRDRLLLPYREAADIALQTVAAIDSGGYQAGNGEFVDWAATVELARRRTVTVPPESRLPQWREPGFEVTTVTVANEASLASARRLHGEGRRPLVLNMADGVTPGGGFLSGARAQEEYLCRASALYATLDGDPMYQAHRARDDYESSDWAILSPDVPVIRDDDGELIPRPWPCSFITSAAPVGHRVGEERSRQLMRERIDRVLAVAAAHDYTDLVLGAWGCGAFGNDPRTTAEAFRCSLTRSFVGRFDRVVFAITDWSPERQFLGPFRDTFA